MKKSKISVIFPLFGNFGVRRLSLAIESVKMQNYPNIEIVVSERNKKPTYKEIAKKQNITYVFTKVKKNEEIYNAGKVRNKGIQKATGTYLYLNDSDIVFMNPNYLSLLMKKMKQKKLSRMIHPPMKHLVKKDLSTFHQEVKKQGMQKAIQSLQFKDGYTTSKKKYKVIKYGYRKRKMVVSQKEWKNITKEDLKKEYGYGLMLFTVHPGAILVERKKVLQTGGYFQGYQGWGFDDVDLQIKLEKTSKKSMNIPKTTSYQVLHLDHPKRFRKKTYEKNKKIFLKRMNLPKKKLFAQDRKHNGFHKV